MFAGTASAPTDFPMEVAWVVAPDLLRSRGMLKNGGTTIGAALKTAPPPWAQYRFALAVIFVPQAVLPLANGTVAVTEVPIVSTGVTWEAWTTAGSLAQWTE